MGVVFPRFGLMVWPLLNSILHWCCVWTDGAVLRREWLLRFPLQLWIAGIHYWLRYGWLKCSVSRYVHWAHNPQKFPFFACTPRYLSTIFYSRISRISIPPTCKSVPELQFHGIANNGIAIPQFFSRQIPSNSNTLALRGLEELFFQLSVFRSGGK